MGRWTDLRLQQNCSRKSNRAEIGQLREQTFKLSVSSKFLSNFEKIVLLIIAKLVLDPNILKILNYSPPIKYENVIKDFVNNSNYTFSIVSIKFLEMNTQQLK